MDELEVKEEAPQADAEELPILEETSEEEASVEEVISQDYVVDAPAGPDEDAHLKAIIEAAIYITDEPLTPAQISAAIGQPPDRVNRLLDELTAEYNRPDRGLSIREIAGGYKMATKPEHHEAIRTFVKNLKPPLKLSLPALETLAVIAYKQPVTAPEIMEIRGVQGIGVLKTLLDRKLIAAAGRKHVVGKPILYKTTKEFLVQFGLRDLAELPTLKEFEELGRLALGDEEELAASDAIVPADPSKDPEPIQEPGPEPQPERDPDPGENPADPQHQPVKAEGSSGLSEEDKEPAA